jgi:hypothetical protein
MLFGSPELRVGETSIERRNDGGELRAEYRVVVANRGSAEARHCTADVTLRGVYEGLDEGRYRFAIEQSGCRVDDGSASGTIPDGESAALEAFCVVDGDEEYARVEFPADDDEPPVDRYQIEGETVRRVDESDHVPFPVFAETEWETATVTVTAENHGTVDRELAVGDTDGVPADIDGCRFDVVLDDEASVPSFETF